MLLIVLKILLVVKNKIVINKNIFDKKIILFNI